MRRDEGRPADEVGRGAERPHDRGDGGDLAGLLLVQQRQQPRQALGEHRLACARRADHVEVVAARGGHLEGVPGLALPDDVDEVGHVRRRVGDDGRDGDRLGPVAVGEQPVARDQLAQVRHGWTRTPGTSPASVALATGTTT